MTVLQPWRRRFRTDFFGVADPIPPDKPLTGPIGKSTSTASAGSPISQGLSVTHRSGMRMSAPAAGPNSISIELDGIERFDHESGVCVNANLSRNLHRFTGDRLRVEIGILQGAGRGERIVAARTDRHDAMFGFEHVTRSGNGQADVLVGHQHHGFKTAQIAIRTPVLGEFDAGARQLPGILFQPGFQPLQKCEGIRRGTGEPGDDGVILAETAHFAGIALHDGLAKADLTVTGNNDLAALADRDDGGGVHERRRGVFSHEILLYGASGRTGRPLAGNPSNTVICTNTMAKCKRDRRQPLTMGYSDNWRSGTRVARTNSHSAGLIEMGQSDGARRAEISRKTSETDIEVNVDLDGTGAFDISTGVGFFDHMLAQLSKHSMVDVTVRAAGDLRIDDHHTVEDTGIALGQAVARALGDRRGINRYASLDLVMDETMTGAALDVSGRPFLVWNVQFPSLKIGTFDTELVREFFQAFSQHAGITLHVFNHHGANSHHIAETCFKAVARTLRHAIEADPRNAGVVPSTKGTLKG